MIPFLKWAGGKRWLTSRHNWLFPRNFECYLEPFLGGGAVFFAIQPHRAILNDANTDLISAYSAIQKNWRAVWRLLRQHQLLHCDEHYYDMRTKRFRSSVSEAARFVYLNRSCFNGIYRVNYKGIFNVPKGTKDQIVFDYDDFGAISAALKKAELGAGDFENVINRSKRGDFVFVDPPYTVKHNMNGFVKYNQKLFSWSDQERLREALIRAKRRGVRALLTNANHTSIREIYESVGTSYELSRSSVIAGNNRHRGTSTELAIAIGYEPDVATSSHAASVRRAFV